MPKFENGVASIYYEDRGSGFPLLLLAPGGLDSTIAAWTRVAINPLEAYAADFRLIGMDQRNAGSSTGPLDAEDPWGSYVEDQLALMDFLGIESFHVMGCCIGCSYALKLIERDPQRIASAVLEQPIGLIEDNREGWVTRRNNWAAALLDKREDLDAATAERFGNEMWQRTFVGSVSEDLVATITTALLVLPGIDAIHPTETGRDIARLAPGAELLEPWKESPESVASATEKVRHFLLAHTPA